MSIGALYPIIKPSLLLDFAKTKQLDPRITFTRASTATYYDGETSALAEQNLFTYSQDLTNAIWAKALTTVTANATTAPDSTNTAVSVIATATTGYHEFGQGFSSISGLPYTVSFYVKANGYTKVSFGDSTSGRAAARFDLTAISVISTGGVAYVSSSIIDVGNGWRRCSLTFTGNGSTYGSKIQGYPDTGATLDVYGVQYTGDAINGIYVWGAQLEQRSSVTAYIPTTTVAITNYIPVLLTAQAGQARFDHNPTTGDSLGLLIEEQRVNLLTYSSDYSNAIWTKTRATIMSAATVAPDGTQTAQQLVEDTTATNSHLIYEAYTITAGSPYIFSMYAKANTRSQISITFDGVVFIFDLSAGTQITGTNGTITSVGNGWYRITCYRASITTASNFVFISLAVANSATYTGNGYSGLFVWGAQLEAGAFATSYIPTVASQVTRTRDETSLTGTNFSSWYNPNEGTIYAEAISTNTSSANEGIVTIQQGTSANLMGLGRKYAGGSTTTVSWWVYTDAITQAYLSVGTVTANVSYKVSATYKTNDIAVSFNGAAPAVDTSAILATQTQLFIGKTYANEHLNGTIKKLAYYPKRLTNTELQGLTS